jgi:hypothetical protein
MRVRDRPVFDCNRFPKKAHLNSAASVKNKPLMLPIIAMKIDELDVGINPAIAGKFRFGYNHCIAARRGAYGQSVG